MHDSIACHCFEFMIRDSFDIVFVDLCLVAYVKAWQTVLNRMNTQILFNFSTYAIATMVVGVLQRDSKIPLMNQLPTWIRSDAAKKTKATSSIRQLLMDFFIFYGDKYQRYNHVVSPFRNRFIYIRDVQEKVNEL